MTEMPPTPGMATETGTGMPADDPRQVVPDWLVNVSALGWRILAIGGLVVILWLIASLLWVVTASTAVAVIVAAFFAPTIVRLRRRGMSPARAAAIVWVAELALITGTIVVL